ncbi:MAG: hypothetical protein ACYDEV_13735 [Acidiferrobacter sp.]
MKKNSVLVGVVTALMWATVVKAEGQAGPGSCLAVVDNLSVPILAQLQSTNGSWINAGMTGLQAHMAGYSETPWIIQPGGVAQILGYRNFLHDYVLSQNGNFNVIFSEIHTQADPRVAYAIGPYEAGYVSLKTT